MDTDELEPKKFKDMTHDEQIYWLRAFCAPISPEPPSWFSIFCWLAAGVGMLFWAILAR